MNSIYIYSILSKNGDFCVGAESVAAPAEAEEQQTEEPPAIPEEVCAFVI